MTLYRDSLGTHEPSDKYFPLKALGSSLSVSAVPGHTAGTLVSPGTACGLGLGFSVNSPGDS